MIKQVIKKDGHKEIFDIQKIFNAVGKSASRIGRELTEDMKDKISKEVLSCLNREIVTVDRVHQIVEISLGRVDKDIYNSYTGYRNYKKEMAEKMDNIYSEVVKSLSTRDRSNSNMNSALYSAKRTNVSKILLSNMYVDFFLTKDERQAFSDGFIYPHDRDNRPINTTNCCVVHMEDIMNGGFTTNGYFCKEPKNISNAVGVIGDIIISCASAQYGGYTVSDIDITLAKYCERTFDRYIADMLTSTRLSTTTIAEIAKKRVLEELDDALQGLEFQLNTRESSRGDFPFTTFSFGRGTGFWEKEVSKTILKVRREGHGDEVKQTAIFPKLVFIVRDDMESVNKDIFEDAILTSSKCMYPDYISESMASPMGKQLLPI